MNQSDQLISQLCSRFLKKPRLSRKINDSFIGSAERIVCISNNTFYYYPKIQEFKDKDFDKLQYVVPKAGVKLTQILQLQFPPRRKNERNYFTIVIPRNKILKYTKTYKEVIVDEEAEGEQAWTFYFDYDIVSLPQMQARLAQYHQRQKQIEKRRQQQIRIQKQKLERQKKKKIEEQYQSLKDAELRSQAQDAQKRQRLLQLQSKQNKKKIFQEADELSFHYYYRKLLYDQNLSNKENYAYQIRLLQKIGAFKQRANDQVRAFIDQLPFRTIYFKENVFFKTQSNLLFKFGGKNLNQQFLSNFYTSLALLKIKKNLKFQKQIRVPLFAFVKYKGFKVLVRSVTPVDAYTKKDRDDFLVHGNTFQSWKMHFLLSDDLTLVCDELNIKPYFSQVHYAKVQIHLGLNLRLIDTKKDPFDQIKALQPAQYSENSNYKITYALDIDQVFPIDLDLENNINQSVVRFRPQFVMNFKDQTGKSQLLSGGALMYALDDQQGQKEDILLAKASQTLKYRWIGDFVNNLDNLRYIPYKPQSFSKILKENGINIRYLGRIYKLSLLPYIKQLCMVEAASRSIKKLYRQSQKQFCTTIFRQQHQQLIGQAFDMNSPLALRKIRMKQLKDAQYQASKSNAIDFLNLIFSSSHQTDKFWVIVSEDVKKTYGIIMKNAYDLAHGYLLLSVLYHCGFKIFIQNKIDLFINPLPFSSRDWIGFDCKTKTLDFPMMKVYQKAKVDMNMPKEVNITRLQLSLLLKRSLRQSQTDTLVQLSRYKDQIQPPKQKYTYESLRYYLIHATQENFQIAHSICQFILPSNHPIFLQVYETYAQIKNFDPVLLKRSAKQHAIRNLGITHWKTSEFLSDFKQLDYIDHLIKAQSGVSKQKIMALYHKIVQQMCKAGKLIEATNYTKKAINYYKEKGNEFNEQQHNDYFKILELGINATYKFRSVQDMLKLSQYLWIALEKYQYKQTFWYEFLLRECMKVYLESNTKKYYLFKLVLAQQQKARKNLTAAQKKDTVEWLRKNCAESKNHINWIKELLMKLQFGYSQLNFASDFFIAFDKNVQKLSSQQFKEGLNQLNAFIEIFGVQYFEEALINRIYVLEKSNLID